MSTVEISVDQMYQIENKGHDMGFLKKFMMENAGAVAVRRLIEKIGDVDSKNIVIFVGMGNTVVTVKLWLDILQVIMQMSL